MVPLAAAAGWVPLPPRALPGGFSREPLRAGLSETYLAAAIIIMAAAAVVDTTFRETQEEAAVASGEEEDSLEAELVLFREILEEEVGAVILREILGEEVGMVEAVMILLEILERKCCWCAVDELLDIKTCLWLF
jgi:hypothetical protein